MRLSCSVEIAGVGEDVFLMKVNKVSIEEFQGILHRDRFISEPELTKKMSEQLVHPIKFEYSNGHVGNIFTTPKVSNTAVNIVRGILSLLDVTIKNGPNTYTLYEPNIHGTCQSTYYLEEDAKNEEFLVKRSINLENCHEKASKVMGMAYAVTCENCEKIATNNAGMVTYSYVIKQSAEGSFIKEASAKEVQAFSPYNVKQGCSLLEVSKTLSLSEVTKAAVSPPSLPYENRGNLKYVFGDEINQMPIIFVTSNNLEKKIKEMLQHLVKTTQNKEAFSNEYFLKLAQLFRYVTIAEIEALWKEFRGDKDYRRWLLDVITSIPTSNSLIFLRNRIRNHELSVMEAAQGLLFTFHLISADVNTVKHAQEFLTVPFIQNSWILRKTVILAYGSLVYKSCQDPTQCPSDMLKPLYDLASSAFREKNEDDMLLALKALGNAGQLSSIKTIMTFLPVQPTARTELSTRVHTAAVLSLRNIAHKDPRKIQEIVLKVLLDGSLDAEVRMHACLVLFETRPSLSLVLTVVEAMLKETNLQVASFCYSQMKSLLWSTTPDNTEL
ncbi:vitellogenin-like [Arapaima gigas]